MRAAGALLRVFYNIFIFFQKFSFARNFFIQQENSSSQVIEFAPMTTRKKSAPPLSLRLGAFAAGLSWSRVPGEVRAAAKRCVADTVAVSLAGAEAAGKIAAPVLANARPGRAGVFGQRKKTAAPAAALANGVAAHFWDFDDVSYTGILHGSAVALPAALSAAQRSGADGRRLLESFIVGVETIYALADMCGHRHYLSGWWSSGTLGGIGAAAAASRAMGLDSRRAAVAVSLAAVQAGGVKAAFGGDAKPWLAGRAAALGVECAEMSAAGASCPPDVFENPRAGFFRVLNGGEFAERALPEKKWRLVSPGIFFKQYPVCSAAHAGAQMAEILARKNGICMADIREAACEAGRVVLESLPFSRPRAPAEAQFSMPFAVACVLTNGGISPAHLSRATLSSPRMRRAMAAVKLIPDEGVSTPGSPEGARITLTLRDGRRLTGTLRVPAGMPSNPLPESALEEKFYHCADLGGWRKSAAERLHARLWNLEKAGAEELARMFSGGVRR